MGTVIVANIPQTLYVTIRRDELNELKDQHAELKHEVARLSALLAEAQRKVLGYQAQAQIA
ncbi:DUF6026 family protein [Pseudomonas typographi]|uniref:Uncharacterized protein n=1 Tax=Pseudomonas typographi TaxID=2715964 RepID=A0ABR7Z6W9_9PSED|nr:DUF6026 family protein [Pseudomonas typographi]MBD1554013.1 hypothetical protein [Pseudomonas typographi]MBD1589242.1 hypothetical protein [Pseudomonas typographi]MBD1601271.1 hypothetical protein [Pseudomonas typographi]